MRRFCSNMPLHDEVVVIVFVVFVVAVVAVGGGCWRLLSHKCMHCFHASKPYSIRNIISTAIHLVGLNLLFLVFSLQNLIIDFMLNVCSEEKTVWVFLLEKYWIRFCRKNLSFKYFKYQAKYSICDRKTMKPLFVEEKCKESLYLLCDLL